MCRPVGAILGMGSYGERWVVMGSSLSLPINPQNYPKNNKPRHCEELHLMSYLILYRLYAILWQSTIV